MVDFEALFLKMSEELMSGDLRTILDHFELPFAIYVGDTSVICQDPDHFLELAGQYHLLMTQGGIARYDIRVTPEPNMQAGGMGTIWIDKTYLDTDGTAVDTSKVRYLVRMGSSRKPKICMAEYVELPVRFDLTKLDGKASPQAILAQLDARPPREIGDKLPGHTA